MELLQYAAHTPAFTASLAQSALPDAPVIEDETAPRQRSWAHSTRAAMSAALHRAAEAIAPTGVADAVAPARQMG
ncbi:hypothetical protein [Sinomonas mesophila]|uniref:hypothetical protein n=1 Tax=Sinomonas mesophila TaxID=1531955 RepID=UPI0009850602|nr:hypothetical protein [Sinomonas mesophila]